MKKFEKNKEKLQEETQKYMYDQSSKFSTVSRYLIFGIIGTIWVITYKEGKLTIPNDFLFSSMLLCLLYLFSDVIHYYTDSRCYEKELYRLDKYNSQEDLDNIHEPIMDQINKYSHAFIIYKFIVLLCSSTYFIIGLFK